MNRSFLTRLLSGIMLVAIALVTIIPGGNILLVTLGIVSLFGLWEMNRVFGIEKKLTGILAYICAVAYFFLLYFEKQEYGIHLLVFYFMALMAVYVFLFPKVKTESVMASLFGVVYVAFMLSFVYLVRMSPGGLYHVWLIFLCSWGSDTCAYMAGVAFGKHQMTPELSPKKSVEGAAGGVIGAALLGLAFAAIFRGSIPKTPDPLIMYPVVCAIGSLIAMTGDLAASAVKRHHQVKDYGTLIPGHGGIMDRFDSVIFVAPAVWLLFQFFG